MCIQILHTFLHFYPQLDSMWCDFWYYMHYNWEIGGWNVGTKPFGCFIRIGLGLLYYGCYLWPNHAFWGFKHVYSRFLWFDWWNKFNENDCIVNWNGFGVLGAWTVAQLCKFRPSESHSPRRELQKFIQGFGSSFSLSWRSLSLSDTFTPSSEWGSPKQGCDKTCTC